MSRSQVTWLVVLTTWIASAPAFADAMFTDGTFAGYTQVGPFEVLSTIAGAPCASCGDPGAALQVTETFGDTGLSTGMAALGFVNPAFSYDPSAEGAIASIDASVDKNATINVAAMFADIFRPMIEQDGFYYLAAINGPDVTGPGPSGFIHFFQSGLAASDFLRFDFGAGAFGATSPNFAGDPMLFGLAQISIVGGLGRLNLEQDYDNLSFDIMTPEPSSILLLVSLLAVVAFAALRASRFRAR